ncbi:glutamine--fructose-6-phosphate transaminase (isomerizing) [Weissella paramesenteroides]|uniref:glutamine--fructose-6-phosphate transaminase (isomerizing) n=1 Tax=Weissella paramesenteroides TaxID=1249 RepID=UPI001238620B|nr:glutamine--fructose-6-phosphate transaminase (isomerizing) [Weissella paramesenteroides]KAA8456523.1 glutamine--fructose-6-phosphate transaminase (isomerizing) [Weissella paramesenteroides]KAA8456534.1 glutamine--fructose-6-phosphate transaminase (isomerizing) [Weissella paramesenteroides]KAA8459144.1 glutamine--fructose-6-phosphate transaminase (isomerizing) [Weissella paramesenteroides]KAA8463551.1 glutamine--fructose-6-phosphate transaminase (isomerizing) [Weissella paramesenteroides]KAA
MFCGIVGFTGNNYQSAPILLKGLQKLEYRGYDSAGLYVADEANGTDQLVKENGRVSELVKLVSEKNVKGTAGIAHTRWATHGVPSVANAHPHVSADGRFYLVHNGVIENYAELKQNYLSDVQFASNTDTEVAVQMIDKFVKEGETTVNALKKLIALMDRNSAYGFLLMDREEPERMYVAKQKSPLLIGIGSDFNVVTSDAVAMLDQTHDFIELHDGEIAIVDPDNVQLFAANGDAISREAFHLDIDATETDKGAYPFYMLKEIDEQPVVIRQLISRYLPKDGQPQIGEGIVKDMLAADRIYIVAAGTSYHAGLVGARLFERWAGIPTEVHVSSEFAYEQPLLSEKPFFIFLSQSGETADSREVLQNINAQGFKSLTLTNVEKSTLWREATYALPLLAGPEIAVASTKAYVAQVTLQAILAYALADREALNLDLEQELSKIAIAIQGIIDDKEQLQEVAEEMLVPAHHAFYIGRGVDSAVVLEAALKLKEISYVQTEGFAAGELKHGTLALIEEDTPVIAVMTQPQLAGLVRGNLAETQARGAKTYTIVTQAIAKPEDDFVLPDINELLTPLVSVVPAQLLAYYTSLGRGLDVDHPRNLAKSVTVQ